MTTTIQTFSGREFNLLKPCVTSIDIDDIAHALSHLCRYTGHVSDFYSVAQHSVLVSNIVPIEDAMWGLLHDAPEAYIGDVSSPLKQLLQDYRYIETGVTEQICIKFDLPLKEPPSVKSADMIALATEKRDLMPGGWEWGYLHGVLAMERRIEPMPPQVARAAFLHRYHELLAVQRQAKIVVGFVEEA